MLPNESIGLVCERDELVRVKIRFEDWSPGRCVRGPVHALIPRRRPILHPVVECGTSVGHRAHQLAKGLGPLLMGERKDRSDRGAVSLSLLLDLLGLTKQVAHTERLASDWGR